MSQPSSESNNEATPFPAILAYSQLSSLSWICLTISRVNPICSPTSLSVFPSKPYELKRQKSLLVACDLMQIAIDQSIFSNGIAEEVEKILEASCQANNQVMNARKRLNSVHRLERLPVKSIKSFWLQSDVPLSQARVFCVFVRKPSIDLHENLEHFS